MKKLWIGLAVVVALCSGVYFLMPEWVASGAVSLARLRGGFERKTLVAEGRSWVYLEGGRGDRVVVLLHGLGGSKDHWLKFAPLLADYRVVIPDLPGQGESEKNLADRYDIPTQVERLHQFTQALGLKRIDIAGSSMGGMLAGTFALKYPEEVRSLGLFAAAGVKAKSPSDLEQLYEKGVIPFDIQSMDDFVKLAAMVYVRPPSLPYPIQRSAYLSAMANKPMNLKIFKDIIPYAFSLEPELAKILAPTFIVWCKQDRMLDVSSATVFEKGLPHATKIVFDGCGHAPMVERSRDTADAYLPFLQAAR